MRFMTVLRVLAYCCVAVPAGAQTTFANIRTEALPTLYVTDLTGHQTTGQLVGLTESALTIQTAAATRTFQASEVSHVDRKGDSLKNGTLIGLAVGVVGSGVLAGSCMRYHCRGIVPFLVLNTGIYTAIGTAIDAAIPGRTRIWPWRKP